MWQKWLTVTIAAIVYSKKFFLALASWVQAFGRVSGLTDSAMTLSLTTFDIRTLSVRTLSIRTLIIRTLNARALS